ncbi:hypothetical protein BU17DRAFT_67421 [Hysterangium stoloniferum]|nr:hypothetical protein BU17DRAFT_67421 [Hysterangium stoloniferum]
MQTNSPLRSCPPPVLSSLYQTLASTTTWRMQTLMLTIGCGLKKTKRNGSWLNRSGGPEDTGVLITGQPGTGKTLFLYYLFVRLLQQKQIVLFSLGDHQLFLFFHDAVYLENARMDPSPPAPKTWMKGTMPLIVGLPLWTREELSLAYPDKSSFQPRMDPIIALKGFPGAGRILQECYPMTIEDPISPSPEDGLNALLDAAIEHFGYAAGDVFHAIYHFDSMTEDHKKAFQISHQALQETTAVLAPGNIVLNSRVSHRILVIHPIPCEYLEADYWALNFKSSWIGRSMLKQLHIAGDINICQTINLLRQRPQTAALAVWYFEPLAHCRLTAGSTGGFWPLVTMTSNGADPPEVISDPSISIPNNVKFAQVQRKVVKFQSTADLPTCFKEHEYYQPVTPNFPLFDAFTVDLYPSRHSAILWILQMTMFRSHGGSAPTVSEPLVEVHYLLISPRAQNDPVQPAKTWRFPKGWNENCKTYDHRGDVYWLEIIFTMICFCTVSSPASQPVQNEFHELASKSVTTCKDQQTMIRYYYNIIRVHMAVGELEQFGGQGAEARDLISSMLD